MTTRNTQLWRSVTVARPDGSQTQAEAVRAALNIHPLVARILIGRGITKPETALGFIEPEHYSPAACTDIPDLARAADVLKEALTAHKHILIWGDFDVDGQTATSLLLDGLQMLGASTSFYIPDRLTESHGIQVGRLHELLDRRQPDILLTCDTGITAHEAIAQAVNRGVTVIVTDHHDLPEDGLLPGAAANVNPKRLPAGHPLRSLPGVGVAFKLMQALHETCGNASSSLDSLLDLVALGIVADVAEQTHDTRYLLQLGMEQLRQTRRPGLLALYKVAGLHPAYLTTESIGFQLGPRLNAAGRLDNATLAVELLTTRESSIATVLAAQLDGLNARRRVMQRQIMTAAQEIIAAQPTLLDFTALVVYQAGWHPGLIGIVAGQLAEQFQRPCVLLTSEPGAGHARGSARSAPGHDIGSAIAAQADMLTTFGGHSGAGGLSLPVGAIDRFRRSLSQTLTERYTGEAALPLIFDAEVTLADVTPDLVEEIHRLAPFGEGNPPVTLVARNLTLVSHAIIGRESLHRRLTVATETGESRQILWWDGMRHRLPEGSFDLAFTPGWNTYQGRREMALTFVDYREIQLPVADRLTRPPRTLVDWRHEDPQQLTSRFRELEPEGYIWAEGEHSDPGRLQEATRYWARRAHALLVYTAPPSQAVLNEVLEYTGAQRIYVAAVNDLPTTASAQFCQRLAKLCKATITSMGGVGQLQRLAGAMASTRETLLWGLRLLAADRVIDLEERDTNTVNISRPSQLPTSYDRQEAESALRLNLSETAAFRRHFRQAAVDTLLDNS